nr:hypothetical protein [Dickeya zeae]
MKKTCCTGEQIAFALKQAGIGTCVGKMGISEATSYNRKRNLPVWA